MANALFGKGREKFLGPAVGQINWANDTIKAILVTSSFTPDIDAQEYVDPSIHAFTGVLTAQTLGSKTVVTGTADAADVTFTTVTSGFNAKYICLFKDSGTPATSPLIALLDTATGMPLTASGGDIIISWDNGVNKIFRL